MRIISRENGFTIVELLIIVICIGILISIAIPNYIKSKDQARESETKANLHIIQVAIERYCTDNSMYPPFLLGGDQNGWNHWHNLNDEAEPPVDQPSNNLVRDVLIEYHYLDSYPQNPFVSDGMRIIRSTTSEGTGPGGLILAGDGDPRFGFDGTTMGNGLSDPVFYEYRTVGIPAVETYLIETNRTLSARTVADLGFLEPPDGLHYMMGGRKAFDENGEVITIATWWPGNFFYRSLFDFPLDRKHWNWYDPGVIPGGTKMFHYILGCYGSSSTKGQDVIRLEYRNWDNTDDCFYRLPPPWLMNARGDDGCKCGYSLKEFYNPNGTGLPEVCGGGDAFTGPRYPYNYSDKEFDNPWLVYQYGAPDGHPDGVILVLTDQQNLLVKRGGRK